MRDLWRYPEVSRSPLSHGFDPVHACLPACLARHMLPAAPDPLLPVPPPPPSTSSSLNPLLFPPSLAPPLALVLPSYMTRVCTHSRSFRQVPEFERLGSTPLARRVFEGALTPFRPQTFTTFVVVTSYGRGRGRGRGTYGRVHTNSLVNDMRRHLATFGMVAPCQC